MTPIDGVSVVGLLACIAGLGLAAGRFGLGVGAAIVFAVIATSRPIAFALGQAGLASILSTGASLSAFVLAEAGLVLTLLTTLGRVDSSWYAFGISVGSLLSFLGIAQLLRAQFDSVLIGAVAVICACIAVLGLIAWAERVRVIDTITAPE